jgi:hypothetical protein
VRQYGLFLLTQCLCPHGHFVFMKFIENKMSNIIDICKVCFTFGKSNFTIMKSRFLFPRYFRIIGLLMALPGFVLGYFVVFKDYKISGFGLKLRDRGYLDRAQFENFTNELALALVIIGLGFIAFSKVRREDELTARIRLNALYWAILINFVFYIFCIGVQLLNVGQISDVFAAFLTYNLFTPLLIFIVRFYYLIYKNRNEYQVTRLHFLPHRPFNMLGKILSLALMVPTLYALFNFWGSGYANYTYCFLPFTFLLWIYSKEKTEDEYINSIRLDAMQLAVYVNYLILLSANLFCYGLTFLLVQTLNLVTIPLIFVIIFQYRLFRLSKQTGKKSGNNLSMGLL